MRNKQNIKAKEKYVILVEGETEVLYLQMLKRNEKLVSIDIKPEIPQKKKLEDQYNQVIALSKVYDKVYWIIDLDIILEHTKSKKNISNSLLEKFLNYKTKIDKIENVILIINHPCLEIWFLIHFKTINKHFSNCEDANKLLKKYIKDYSKNQAYFTKTNNDIYLKLKPYLNTAIKNSKSMPKFNRESPTNSLCEMYKLFEDLSLSP